MRPRRMPAMGWRIAALAALPLVAGCATLPAPQSLACADAAPPTVTLASDARTAHARLDVMTYNIEGLHWPAKHGRAAELEEIGRRIADLRAAGEAPDVIVFQEVFSNAAVNAVKAAGYPSEVAGPSRSARRDLPAGGRLPGRRWREGELGIRFASGGLVILSRYPITMHKAEPFGHHACAGLDCLSNKGALFAEVAVPGAPEPVRIFDSHMNTKRKAGVDLARTFASHQLEAGELAQFVGTQGDPGAPTVLAGDFNMRHAPDRLANFERLDGLKSLTLVHRYCLDGAAACDVRLPWRGQSPWLETEDLQFFRSGHQVALRPVRVQSMFDGGDGGPQLSDHKAFRVTYDLSWPVDATPAPGACLASPPAEGLRQASLVRTFAAAAEP